MQHYSRSSSSVHIASDDSRSFVADHLETCENCRRELNRMKAPEALEQAVSAQARDPLPFSAMRKKMKKHSRILVTVTAVVTALAVCVLLIGLIIYHLPQRRLVSMPVCNAAGEVSYLEIDIKYYRRLFSRPWVEGTVTFDGVVYHDSKSAWGERQKDGSYWDWDWWFKAPDNVLPANLWFYKKDNDPIKMFDNFIAFYDLGNENSFDNVVFTYKNDDMKDFVKYYGPASTVEEARQVSEDLGWYFD